MLRLRTHSPLPWLILAAIAGAAVLTANRSMSQDEAEALEFKAFYPQIARLVADGLPQAHVTHAGLGDSIAEQALDNYLSTLDFDRTYFLAADIEEFREVVTDLDDQLRDGHLEFAYDVFDRFKQRVRDRLAYVEQAAERDFDFEVDEEYETRRKEAAWPADEEARDDLWRRKLKNEVLNRMVADRIAEEFPAEEAEGSEDSDTAVIPGPDLSPMERAVKMHRQFASVIDGHDAEWVLQSYLNAFAQAYDTHSAYLSPRAVQDFDISMRLSLTGIGAVLQTDDGAAKIVRLIPGGPAERDGRLRAGDRIVAVAPDGEEFVDILYWPLYQAVRLIRGEEGSRVVLDVIPASDPSGATVKRIELTRDTVRLEEREARARVREIPAGPDGPDLRLGVLTLPDFYADQQGLRRGMRTPRVPPGMCAGSWGS